MASFKIVPSSIANDIFQVSGRILIDYYGYQKHYKGLTRSENNQPNNLDHDDEESSENSNYVKRLSNEKQKDNKDKMLAREQDLVFVSPILVGFSLKAKLWREHLILFATRPN